MSRKSQTMIVALAIALATFLTTTLMPTYGYAQLGEWYVHRTTHQMSVPPYFCYCYRRSTSATLLIPNIPTYPMNVQISESEAILNVVAYTTMANACFENCPQIAPPDEDITWDFESGSTIGWVRIGTAFNYQPTYGDNPTVRNRGQPSGHAGNYWIGGFEKYQGLSSQKPGSVQGDGPTGMLTSKIFTIPSGSLSFLVGGGSDFKTRVELLVAGISVLHVSGRNSETMHRVTWDISPWAGQTGQIRLVDNASGGWGHINADDFRFSANN